MSSGLVATRSLAQALILAGKVLVDDVPVDKAGSRVRPGAAVRLRGAPRRYVSRGGDKLAGALEDLGVDPRGLRCLDVGASTGGFTDCLLQHGAESVVAVDVGYGQLHPKLREDSRVRVLERTNARQLQPAHLAAPVDLVVIDASFISLRLLLPPVAATAPGATVLALVKPQFEVGRGQVGKGGVVRDDALREAAADDIERSAAQSGYAARARVDCRLAGPKGNREIFLHLVPGAAEAPEGADGAAGPSSAGSA